MQRTASPSSADAPQPRASAVGITAQVMASVLWIPQAALLAWAVQGLADGLGLAAVAWPAAGIVALGVLRAACEAWGARQVFRVARARLAAIRVRVARVLAARSPLDKGRPASGLAASVLAEQAESVLPWLLRYPTARWRCVVVPLVLLPAVAWHTWVAALVLLLAAPLIPIFMAIVGWRAQAASREQLGALGTMQAFLLDRLRGVATLRALGAVDATALRLRHSAQALQARTMAVLRIAFLSSAVLELFSALGVAMVAVYVGFHLLGTLQFGTWGQQLTLGQGLFVLLLAPSFFEPLRELSAVWHDRAAGEAALEALEDMAEEGVPLPGALDDATATAPAAAAAPTGGTLLAAAPAVELRAIGFAHPGAEPLFTDLDLSVAAGEHVALTGPSGAGKTVLLSLIAGLVPAAQGEVLVGGTPLTAANADALRSRMAWIGQRPHIFTGSVRHNLTLGRADADSAMLQAATRKAGLDAVAQADLGVALGEGGQGLSGGEAARLALARAALQTGAGLVLADEPTAHLDADTAERVTDALLELARGRTLVVATHDPRLIARMQRTVRLQPRPAVACMVAPPRDTLAAGAPAAAEPAQPAPEPMLEATP
jgi:ATP-binding cassette subfamily C protein CydD